MRTSRSGAVLLACAALCLGLTALMPGTVGAATTGNAGARSLHSGGSVDEAWLTGAAPGDRITLLHYGAVVSNPANPGTADSLGSLIIRDLSPGAGYSWGTTPHTADTGPSPSSPRRQPLHRFGPVRQTAACTRASTTSPCVTASSLPPRCGIPTA